MNRNLVNTSKADYHKKAKLKIGFIVVAALILALILSAVIILPKLAISKDVPETGVTVVAIVPQNDGKIGVKAHFDKVFVTVQYSNGTTGEVALSELLSVGLDVSKEANLDNVILNFGGFKQTVKYQVLSTMKTLEYVASAGGRIEGDKIQNINAGSDASTVVAIPDEGYKFVEWTDGNPNASRTDTKISIDERIEAVFQKISYTVVFFYPDGTTAREERVLYNEAATKVPLPSEESMQKYGYVFAGWSESYAHITADTFITPVYKKYATDLYLEYTKGIEGNNLGTSDALTYYPKDILSTIRIKANPERTFTGWSVLTSSGEWVTLLPNGDERTLAIDAPNNYMPFVTTKTGTTDEYVLNFTTTARTEELRIKANFVYNQSTITFTSMATKAHDSVLVDVGKHIGDYINVEKVYDTEGGFLKKIVGYTFQGWYIKNGEINKDGTPKIIGNTTTFTAPTDLIAYWTKNIYDVNFLKGDSENLEFTDTINLKVYYQDPLGGAISGAFPEFLPYKQNYTFKGWYLVGEGGAPTSVAIDRTYKIVSEVTNIMPVFEVNTKNLSVFLEGSGVIKVGEIGGAQPSTIAGIFTMDVTKNYVVKFSSGAGYTLKDVTVETTSGKVTHTYNAKTGELSIDAIIGSDYKIKAYFKLSEYLLTINNGSDTTSGSISYQETQGDQVHDVVSTDVTILSKVNEGISKNIWISSRDGYYINSIKVGDNQIANIPTNATSYTVVLDNITANVIVDITYAKFIFSVVVPPQDPSHDKGTIQFQGSVSDDSFIMGASPTYFISAKAGYYIKSLKINGTAVDPYRNNSNVKVSKISVNGVELVSGGHNAAGTNTQDADVRVTSYIFVIENLSANKMIEAEYQPLFYNVKIGTIGVGTTNIANAVVKYGDALSLTADTVDGYYVYSYTINGSTIVYENISSSQAVKISNILKDQEVVFTFVKSNYAVTYISETGGAKVQYVLNGDTKTEGLPTTINCQAATNQQFTLVADSGYQIHEVWIDDIPQKVAFNAHSHIIKLDNLSSGHTIKVTTTSVKINVSLFVSNGDGCTITAPSQLKYNETLIITIKLAGNKSLDRNKIETSYKPIRDDYVVDTDGTITISMFFISKDIAIYIPIMDKETPPTLAPYKINLQYNSVMGELKTVDGKTEAQAGDSVTYRVTPNVGYMLKYLIVNGVKVEPNINKEYAEYTVINISATQNVQAIFVSSEFTLTLRTGGGGKGTVTARTYAYKYGEELDIRITSELGYRVDKLLIGATGGTLTGVTQDVIDNLNSVTSDYRVTGEKTTTNLTIEVRFEPKDFKMTVKINEGGSVGADTNAPIGIVYNQDIAISIVAKSNYFIDSIIVNGASIDPATLGGNPAMNSDIQKYIRGTLMFTATTDNTVVEIRFMPNVYKVTIADAINGTTLVSTATSNPSDGSDLRLFAGDKLTINMSADEGYHISELIINGAIIENWKLDSDTPNNNRIVYFAVDNISGNLTIRVTFEINSYEIQTNTQNKSVNFMQYDKIPSSYGTLNIYGKTPDQNGKFSDIVHGSDIRFIISPVRSKGYYISKFTITWVDPTQKDNNKTITEDFTAEAYKNGQITFNVRANLQMVTAEFSKETFSYSGSEVVEQNDSPYIALDRALTVRFRNPYAGSDTSVAVTPIDGKYEFGLLYLVTAFAGTGYSRTSFLVNGVERNSSVRNDIYSSVVQGNINIISTYTINMYRVDIFENTALNAHPDVRGAIKILDEQGNDLWQSSASVASGVTKITSSGKVIVYKDYIMVTHNTRLRYQIIPANELNGQLNGYMVSSLKIDNTVINFPNGDIEQNYNRDIVKNGVLEVSFILHNYSVKAEFSKEDGGGRADIFPNNTDWGTSAKITLTVLSGYKLIAVYINNEINYEALQSFQKIIDQSNTAAVSEYTLLNIKKDSVIRFVLECVALDVKFLGAGYNQEFDVIGARLPSVSGIVVNENTAKEQAHFSSTNNIANATAIPADGIIVGGGEKGARFNDTLTIYFRPINGYKIESVEIVHYDLNNNIVSRTSEVLELTKYDEDNGYYKFAINAIKGTVTINVAYAVKTYDVKVTTFSGGKIATQAPNKIAHHKEITFEFYADYGYHLDRLEINGREVVANNLKKSVNGSLVYTYTTTLNNKPLIVNDALMNKQNEINVQAKFAINIFKVAISVTNRNANDSAVTLRPVLTNMEIQYGQNATAVIEQNRSEGYSIVAIGYANKANVSEGEQSSFGIPDELQLARLEFPIGGAVMDSLDYHDGATNALHIYYYTAIDTHKSMANTYLFETNKNPNDIPKPDGASAFSLTSTYNNGMPTSNNSYDYFVDAVFTFNMSSQVADDYYFAGFQENIGAVWNSATGEWVGGEWRYVENGVNGITLGNNGEILTYTIKADRCFRAVVFRMYEVQLEVHPEFKHISGNNASGNFDMTYRTYAKVTAKLLFEDGKKPNVGGDAYVLNDTNGNDRDGLYVYRVFSGSKLVVTSIDTIKGASMNPTTAINYMYITRNGTGEIKQTPATLVTGAHIDSDKLVYAYFNNNTYISFFLETLGGASGNEGANVTYHKDGTDATQSLQNGSLLVAPNSRVTVNIEPKDNYEFDDILEMEAKKDPAPNGNKQFTGAWISLTTGGGLVSADGMRIIEIQRDANQRITKVILNLIVTENVVYKMKFCKLLQLRSEVELIDGETTNQEIITRLTPSYIGKTAGGAISTSLDGQYRYSDKIIFTVPLSPNGNDTNMWNKKYQFIGLFINGVNSYKMLGNGYPTGSNNQYVGNYVMYEYDANSRPDGVNIVSKNGKFVVDVVAKYIPVYNISIENEYNFNFDGDYVHNRYFDPGQISYATTAYNMDYPEYYKTNAYVMAKTVGTAHTDKSLQVGGKVNESSSNGLDEPNSQYNSWNDNKITLSWTAGTIPAFSEAYDFKSWQYYTYDINSRAFMWKNIPYIDPQPNTDNKVTSKTFTFPVGVLLQNSYIADARDGYKFDAAQYDEQSNYIGTENISSIRIRPLFQRVLSFKLEREVYYEQEGILNNHNPQDNPARIDENRSDVGRFNYYDIINLDAAISDGYRFLGWFSKDVAGTYKLVTNTSGLNANNSMTLVGGATGANVSSTKLKVRITEENYDVVTNTLKVYARYIKRWDINISIANTSGTSSLIQKSVPYIYTGAVDNNDTIITASREFHNETYYTIIADAGAVFGFGLHGGAVGSDGKIIFNANNDKYLNTTTRKGNTVQTWSVGEDVKNDEDRLKFEKNNLDIIAAQYIIKANCAKTISVNFYTVGTLIIKNIYKGAEFRVPNSLKKALELSSSFVRDGDSVRDADGAVDGKIQINNIPIKPDAIYDGVEGDTFGCRLPKMSKGTLNYANTGIVKINFNGNDESLQKTRTITYYGEGSITGMALPFAGGDGSEEQPYLINNLYNLMAIDSLYVGNDYNATYMLGDKTMPIVFKLDRDIDVGDGSSKQFTPMTKGTIEDGKGFNGKLVGAGHILSNIRIQSGSYIGLFAKTNGAIISGIRISGSCYLGATNSNYVGILVGCAQNTTISDVRSQDGNEKIIKGNEFIGGLVGLASNGTKISGCSINRIDIRASTSAGGLIGKLQGSGTAVSDSFTESAIVTAEKFNGGAVVGFSDRNTTITSCKAITPKLGDAGKESDKTTQKYLGGISGYNAGTIKTSSISGSRISIYSKKPATAFRGGIELDEENYGAGGIVGYNAGAVDGCFLDGTGQITLVGGMVGGIVGVNVFGATITNCNTGNFNIVIEIDEGGNYGGHVGCNLGRIINPVTQYASNQNVDFSYTFLAVKNNEIFATENSYELTGQNAKQDTAEVYIGGIVGYNAYSGIIENASYKGKIVLNRKCGNSQSNSAYVGGLAGASQANPSDVIGAVNGTSIVVYINVWADIGGAGNMNPAAVIAKIGAYVGSGTKQGSGSGNKIIVRKIGSGSAYVDWTGGTWQKGTNAKNYGTVKIITEIEGGTSVDKYVNTTNSIPSQLWDQKKWAPVSGTVYRYRGNLRQVFEQ